MRDGKASTLALSFDCRSVAAATFFESVIVFNRIGIGRREMQFAGPLISTFKGQLNPKISIAGFR